MRYDRGETQRLLQHLHTCKSAYNGQPAAGHTGYVQTLVRFVVVVVQVKPCGMQEKLVSFFHFADACSQDGMDVGRKGGFVYGHRLIELEIAADGFRVEIEIIEVKSEQHVTLLDVARAQNAVP